MKKQRINHSISSLKIHLSDPSIIILYCREVSPLGHQAHIYPDQQNLLEIHGCSPWFCMFRFFFRFPPITHHIEDILTYTKEESPRKVLHKRIIIELLIKTKEHHKKVTGEQHKSLTSNVGINHWRIGRKMKELD